MLPEVERNARLGCACIFWGIKEAEYKPGGSNEISCDVVGSVMSRCLAIVHPILNSLNDDPFRVAGINHFSTVAG